MKPVTHSARLGRLVAEWHDATHVCIPGHSCWVAVVFHADRPGLFLDVAELDSPDECERWAGEQLRARQALGGSP